MFVLESKILGLCPYKGLYSVSALFHLNAHASRTVLRNKTYYMSAVSEDLKRQETLGSAYRELLYDSDDITYR